MKRIAGMLLVACSLAGVAVSQTECHTKDRSVDLPLSGNPDWIKWSYHTKISVGSGPLHTVQIDTGSVGIVVPRLVVPPELWNQNAPIRQIDYSSSNNYFVGKFITTPVALGDPVVATTAPIGVLVAACRCKLIPGEPGAGAPSIPEYCAELNGQHVRFDNGKGGEIQECAETTNNLGMMGVGFGRGSSLDRNPFLSLPEMLSGTMTPGYTITERGIRLGITPKDSRGYTLISLQPSKTAASGPLQDWAEPTACVDFPGHPEAASICGGFLADTGLATMLLTVPPELHPGSLDDDGKLPYGTVATVKVDNFAYSFRIGGGLPAPSAAEWRAIDSGVPHINTGRHVLAVADYLFDDECGRIGFRPLR